MMNQPKTTGEKILFAFIMVIQIGFALAFLWPFFVLDFLWNRFIIGLVVFDRFTNDESKEKLRRRGEERRVKEADAKKIAEEKATKDPTNIQIAQILADMPSLHNLYPNRDKET